jgi:hypothetical protein
MSSGHDVNVGLRQIPRVAVSEPVINLCPRVVGKGSPGALRPRSVPLAILVALGAIGIIAPLGSPVRAGSPPVCTYADTTTHYPRLADWYRALVDTKFLLPGSFAPRDLVPVSCSGAGVL